MEEGTLQRENLSRSLGSYDAAGLLVGSVMAMLAVKKPPNSTLYPVQRRNGALSPIIKCSTRHWLDPFAREKSGLSLKTYCPSERELADKMADETLNKWK